MKNSIQHKFKNMYLPPFPLHSSQHAILRFSSKLHGPLLQYFLGVLLQNGIKWLERFFFYYNRRPALT